METECEVYANIMRLQCDRMRILYERNATAYEPYTNRMRFYAKKSKAKKSKANKTKTRNINKKAK